jgi:hypothetical protein
MYDCVNVQEVNDEIAEGQYITRRVTELLQVRARVRVTHR